MELMVTTVVRLIAADTVDARGRLVGPAQGTVTE